MTLRNRPANSANVRATRREALGLGALSLLGLSLPELLARRALAEAEAGRPAPRGPDNKPLLGQSGGNADGFWAYPSSTVLMEKGVNVAMNRDGLLKNVADASKVAPMQPWALGVYRNRQTRFLQDDPGFINCKPPGGVRQFQLREGVQFVEDRAGHDRRYSLNVDKLKALGWEPRHSCEEAIRETARWYVDNEWWWKKVRDEEFDAYYAEQYGARKVIG